MVGEGGRGEGYGGMGREYGGIGREGNEGGEGGKIQRGVGETETWADTQIKIHVNSSKANHKLDLPAAGNLSSQR